jgi:hypothetical protein
MKRLLFWPLALLLLLFGLACLAYPLAMLLAFDPGAHLLDDTRAAYGAGRDTGMRITRASCTRQEFGHDGGTASESPHSIEYDCEFDLEPPAPPPEPEPDYAHMTREQQYAAWVEADKRWLQRLRASERPRGPNDPPSTLRRRLPASAAGRPLPAVRLMTRDGVPPRFALVWPDGGLGHRWFRWAWETAIFLAFAVACAMAIPALRRKLAPRR